MDDDFFKIDYFGKEVLFYLPNREDHIQNVIRNSGTFYEIEMLRAILKFVPTGGNAIDIGANIGNHSIFFSSICGLKTFAFEPFSDARGILEKNIKINKLDHEIKVFPVALGSQNEKAKLVSSNNSNIGMARVMKNVDVGDVVDVRPLDEFGFVDVSLIKIDVEGMETEVLLGAKETIKKNRPVIFAEVQTASEYNSVRGLLYEEGYITAERYNATPTVMFWPKEKAMDYLPFFVSSGQL